MTMKRLVIVLFLLLSSASARAQITATIRATDASTGADVQRVGDDANDALRVTIVSPSTVPVAGAVTQSGAWLVQGVVAHGATYSGNPLPSGCYGSATAPTAVSDGQIARLWCLTNGALAVQLQNASIAITAAALPLPAGAATSAAQTTGNASVASIDTKTPALVSGRVPVDGSGVVQPASQSGTWSVRTQDGAGNALTSAARGSERALSVQVVDAAGAQVTSFGGGGGGGSTIGSAVPSTGTYNGLNVAGTLRGWTGLSVGSQYAGTVAIVDGSGNQVTSFGGSGGTASNFGSAVPTTGTAAGFSDGTNMQAPRVFDADTGAGTQYVPGVVLRASGSGGSTEVGTAAAPLRVDPTGGTAQPVTDNGSSITVDAPVGSPAFVRLSDGSAAITNLAVNLAQVAGATVTTGSGTATGAIRVELPTNGTGVVGLAAGTNVIGYVGGKPTYGSKTTLLDGNAASGSGFASLANSTGGYQTNVVDNTSTRYRDFRIRVQTKGQTSGTAQLDVYVYTALGDTTYTDGATGSAGTFTVANRFNSKYLGSVTLNAGAAAVQAELQLGDVFSSAPDKWGLIFINRSGAALSATATDHLVEYEGVN